MKTLQNILAVTGMIAVPTVAFLIRMWQGDTRNPNEELISQWIKHLMSKYFQNEEKTSE